MVGDFAWRNFFAAINFVYFFRKKNSNLCRKVHNCLILTSIPFLYVIQISRLVLGLILSGKSSKIDLMLNYLFKLNLIQII